MHHAATPFQSGWHRIRTEGWRRGRQQFNARTRSGSGNGTLPIAGRRPAAGTGTAAGGARGATGGAAKGGVAAAFALDVTDVASIHKAVGAVEVELGPIDALVNNAAMQRLRLAVDPADAGSQPAQG